MKISLKALLVVAMVLMAVLPGAYGITVSGGGTENGVSNTFNTKITASSGATVNCAYTPGSSGIGNGPISIIGQFSYFENNHQATDANGNHAELHAKVTYGQNLNYWNEVVPAKGDNTKTYALAQQGLSVDPSYSIQCSQSASDAAGNKASSGTTITSGSLTGYYGMAGAGFNIPSEIGIGVQHAEAGQWFDIAVGNSIAVQEQASNNLGYTASSTTTALGTSSNPAAIEGYYGWSGSGTYAMLDIDNTVPDDTKVVFAGRTFGPDGGAYGSTVTLEDAASNKLISAKEKTTVRYGSIWAMPLIYDLSSAIAMEPYTTTETTPRVFKYGQVAAGIFVDAQGDTINLAASAQQVQNQNNQGNDNNQGDLNRASITATIQKGRVYGMFGAGSLDPTKIGALLAGSTYGSGSLTYGSKATSTSGAHAAFGPITEPIPPGFWSEAVVDLATGQVIAE